MRINRSKGRYWHIQGFDSLNLIFETTVPIGQFSENSIQEILKTLAAKAGLTELEIIGALARKRTHISNELLQVHRGHYPNYSCGTNPYFTARVVDKDGKPYFPPS